MTRPRYPVLTVSRFDGVPCGSAVRPPAAHGDPESGAGRPWRTFDVGWVVEARVHIAAPDWMWLGL
jgi:hypothetical protein